MNKRAFVSICIALFVAMLGMGIISLLMAIYAKCMGACSGLFNASQDMGNFIGPILFGWVTDRFGLASMFLTGAVAGIIAVPFMFWSLYGKNRGQEYSGEREAEPVEDSKR